MRTCYQQCQTDNTVAAAYIVGAIHNELLAASISPDVDPKFCLRDDVNIGQIRDVVCTFLDDNPGLRDSAASIAIGFAMYEAFPCE